MEERMIIAGFGGQGVLLTGKLLGFAACHSNNCATFLPSYGGQQRGGPAMCTVVLSDQEISSPVIGVADTLMAFNQNAIDEYLPRLKTNGKLYINSSLCNTDIDRDDVEVVEVPIDDLAKEMGKRQVANIIMLGVYISKTGIFTQEEMNLAIEKFLHSKPQFIELNKDAIKKGIEVSKNI